MYWIHRRINNVKFSVRQTLFGAAIAILKRDNGDPRSVFAPIFSAADAFVNRIMDEDDLARREDVLGSIGFSYYEEFGSDEGVVALAEIATMSDASFQLWLDQECPDLTQEMRELALARFRAGTLWQSTPDGVERRLAGSLPPSGGSQNL